MGHRERARELFEESLTAREQRFGSDHIELANTLSNLAALHLEDGHLEAALPAFERVVAIRRRALGDDHPEVGSGLANVAAVLREMGRHEESLAFAQDAVQRLQRAHGPDDLRLASPWSVLAAAYLAVDRFDDAQACLMQCLRLRRLHLADGHTDVASVMTSLGELELRRDAPAEAHAWFGQALAAIETVHGAEHPDLLRPLADLSLAAERHGDGAAAIAYARRRLAISIAVHGACSGHTLFSHLRLVELVGDFGDDADAMAEFERLRPLLLDPADCDAADAISLMRGAGRFLLRAGHVQDALPYLRQQVALAAAAERSDPRPPARLAGAWAWLVIGGHLAGSTDDARAAYLAVATLEVAAPDSGDAQRFGELASLASWFTRQDDAEAFADLHRHARERLGAEVLPAAEDLLEWLDD